MLKTQKHAHISVRIVVGFLAVLVLMASLAVIGLRYISDTNQRLRQVVESNNLKTQLASTMQTALRERALSMHAISVMTDPFEKDAELQRFNNYASVYLAAREHLEQLPLNAQEREILERISILMGESNPEVQAVVDMSMESRNAELFDRIRNRAMPRQRKIAEEVNRLILLQQRLADAAMRSADFSYRQVRTIMVMIGMLAMLIGLLITLYVSRRVSLQAKLLTAQALYDPLTGLPNRSLLQDRLEQAIVQSRRSKRPFGVALMDLDRFKDVNDTLGHNVGDELLREVGRRLKELVRADDTVARMGGDEFVVILQGMGESGIPSFVQKLQTILEPVFFWGNQSIHISASTGIALFPQHAADASSLIRYADIAMYQAKRADRDYAVYAPEHEQSSREMLTLKSELRDAIQSGQLVLHYQPKINHHTCSVIGLEALVRWHHPRKGLLAPEIFIPLAEEAGLIRQLTHWVLNTALSQLALLQKKGHSLTMSVNLSARSLHDLEIPELVAAMLQSTGIEPGRLILEITESAVMSNPADALAILRRLDSMGVNLAIDDFGTGYSSLAHLRQLPVDEIKIDKSFVIEMEENENDAVIVRSIIDLAHNLGLKVIAEGVDTKDAWDTLTILGCDHSQGYYLSRPLSGNALGEWLEQAASTGLPALRPHLSVSPS